jgi:hypothetical protein
MLVYQCGFVSWLARKPLTEHTNQELLLHLENSSSGNIEEEIYERAAVDEQIRIILYAREMGWL